MTKLQTLIIDDEPIALEKLRAYVGKVNFLQLAGEFSSAVEAMEFIASGNKVDLIFTDINMPDLNGLDFVRSLPSPPMIVFSTAYAEYGVESYRLSAIDYLLKPFGFADFQRAASKALERRILLDKAEQQTAPTRASSAAEPLFIKVDYRWVRIDPSTVDFIKGYGEYLQVYVDGQPSPLLTLSSFASILEKLPSSFMQVHRSFVVNLDRIVQIERSRITTLSGETIPVGDSYRQRLTDYIQAHGAGSGQRRE